MHHCTEADSGCRSSQEMGAYLVDEVVKSHGSCIEGKLQLSSAAHHAVLDRLSGA